MREDILIMSQKEVSRLQIIQKVFSKQINQRKAAEVLRLTDRQIRRCGWCSCTCGTCAGW